MEQKLSMYAYLKNNVKNLDEEKIVYQNNTISARKLFADIDALSTFLYDLGIRKGDSVGICLPNIPQAVVAIYAINKLGAIINAIHPRLQDAALYNALIKTNTKVVFMYDLMVPKHSKTLKRNNIKIISCAYSDYLLGIKQLLKFAFIPLFDSNIYPYLTTLKKTREIAVDVDDKSDAVYLHSSGTMGESKTVRLSSYALNSLSDNLEKMITEKAKHKILSTDAMLMLLPVFHGFGMGVCVHFSLHKFKIVMVPFFTAKKVAKIIKSNNINYIVAIPNMLKKLSLEPKMATDALQNIKLVFSGGDKLSDKVRDEFNSLLQQNGSKCKVMEGYGLSELTSVVTININPEKNNSQGLPMPNIDIAIIKEGKVATNLELGEICVSSPSVMNGYFDSASPHFSTIDGKSYLHTGDVGYLDDEGYLYIKDRLKRIVIIGGINIFPQEVESLIASIEGVNGVCIARYLDNGKARTKAYIELKSGMILNAKLQTLIADVVQKNIMKYAVPSNFEQVDSIKLNKMGKVDFSYYENLLKNEQIS